MAMVARGATAAILAAACGGGTTSGKITTTRSGDIGFGVLSCFTGILAPLGRAMLQGAQVAQTAIDAHGGVLGRQLAISYADSGCNETDAVPAVRQLLAEHVVGIVGPETQEIGSVLPIVTAAKIPTEFQGGWPQFDHNTNPYLWRDSPSDSQLGVAMSVYAKKSGYDTGALVFYSDPAAQSFVQPITRTYEKLGGKIVADLTLAPDQPSYRAQMEQLVAARPQVVFTQTDAATAATILGDLRALGAQSIPFVGTDVTGSGEYLKAITYPVAHDHLVSIYGSTETGPASEAFRTTLAQAVGTSATPLANANYAYDAVVSLALAMDRAGTTDGPAVVGAMTHVTNPPGTACTNYGDCLALLKQGKDIDYEGASGVLDYDRYNNVFGAYGAFRANLAGDEEQVALLSAEVLARATP
jgi:ABC-type branched-subunit amino acid transport system substrate-binding protein